MSREETQERATDVGPVKSKEKKKKREKEAESMPMGWARVDAAGPRA